MVWYTEFGSVFFLGIAGSFVAIIHLIVKYMYRIKISECSCCCIKVTRDIEAELKIDIIEGDTTDETHVKAQKRKSSALNLPI